MPVLTALIDLDAAERFVNTHARLLERRRLAVLLHDADLDGMLSALAAYQNDDGGFGHALEPDVRGPQSETTSTLSGLEVLDVHAALDHDIASRALAWVTTVICNDGGIPFMLPTSDPFPHAPWMQSADEGSHLTYGFAAVARRANSSELWLQDAENWCWDQLSRPDLMTGILLKFALTFLDAHPDDPRTDPTVQTLRGAVGADGCVPVPGGTADEKLTPLALSAHPGRASRSIFTDQQIHDDLERLAAEQQDDGGWIFDWAEWCPAQGLDWRGVQTLTALQTLREHGAT